MPAGGKAIAVDISRAARSRFRLDARQLSHTLTAYLIGLNISDLITTRAVLRRGGGEANPFMRGLVDDMLHASAVKCVILTTVVALVLRSRFPARAAWTLGLVTTWYAIVVGWNLAIIASS
jgi:hypothetical protein